MDEFNINNQKPAIIVEGDVMLKEYQFIVEESKDKLLKIGRVNQSVRKYIYNMYVSMPRLSMISLT